MEPEAEASRKAEEKKGRDEDRTGREAEGDTVSQEDTDGKGVGTEEEEDEEAQRNSKQEPKVSFQSASAEQREEVLSSNSDEDLDHDDDDDDDTSDYTVMKGDGGSSEVSEVKWSRTEDEDQELSGYVQDSFDFLDQMDYSVLEHMDCNVPYQVTEFSVEPPGHSDDEYETMHPSSHHAAELLTFLQPGPGTHSQSPTEPRPLRALSLDVPSRHTKSLSLPRMLSPSHGAPESSDEDDSEDSDSSYEDEQSMFVKSLPSGFFLSGFGPEDGPCSLQSSDGAEGQSPLLRLPAGRESTPAESQGTDRLKEVEDRVYQEQEELNKNKQR